MLDSHDARQYQVARIVSFKHVVVTKDELQNAIPKHTGVTQARMTPVNVPSSKPH
jgi:hypothetical protein